MKITNKFFNYIKAKGSSTFNPFYNEMDMIENIYPSNIESLLHSDMLCLITPGRSGTKTLIDYINDNTNAYAVHKPKVTNQIVANLFHKNLITKESAFWSYLSSRESYLVKAYSNKTLFVDGDCKYLPIVPVISEMCPNSKFIHLVRDPKSFIISGLNRGYFKSKPSDFFGYLDNEKATTQIEKIASFWNEANIIAESLKSELGKKRVLTMKSEDMFNNSLLIVDSFKSFGFDYCLNDNLENSQMSVNNANKNITSNFDLDDIDKAIIKFCETRSIYGYR